MSQDGAATYFNLIAADIEEAERRVAAAAMVWYQAGRSADAEEALANACTVLQMARVRR